MPTDATAVVVTEYGDADVLSVEQRERPEPSGEAVLVDVAAAGVNFADVEMRRGNYPDGPTPPFVPGLEVAGTVEAAGSDADWTAGDRVAALTDGGGYATATTAQTGVTFAVPDELSDAEAAGVLVQGLTAHNVLHEWGGLDTDDATGKRVLVQAAAGGVGSLAVQLAAHASAEVLGTASTERKLDFARELGLDHGIRYEDEDVAERVAAITDGEGVDLVLDGVGGRAFDASVEALAPAGTVVSYGMASGSIPTVATPRLFFENQSVVGYHLNHALEHVPERVLAAMPRLRDLLATGAVEVVVDEQFPLPDAADAHRYVENRKSVGKVVLEP